MTIKFRTLLASLLQFVLIFFCSFVAKGLSGLFMVAVRNGDGYKMVMRVEHGLVKREVVENNDGGSFGSMIDENGERGIGVW
ncbi:hypothetical protein V6N12_069097 [Hibiscus sabdariffa]|uniref:Transmembrane protein n=1 Tax=Hibiscus sabdariffa TaxID=183260 RepID=A0ABR2FCV6_9ROSI